MIRIAIVDDKRLNRVGIKDELSRSGKVRVIFTAQNGEEFLEQMRDTPDHDRPEIVLMDIDMPVKNGIETVREGKTIYPRVEFLMLTVFDEDTKIFEAIKAGASGYILKDEHAETILNFIAQVKEFGAVPLSPAVARKALKLMRTVPVSGTEPSKAESNLTAREEEVLRKMVDGLDYKQIAADLEISPNTVRNQIASIYKKLHVNGRVDAVKLALKKGII